LPLLNLELGQNLFLFPILGINRRTISLDSLTLSLLLFCTLRRSEEGRLCQKMLSFELFHSVIEEGDSSNGDNYLPKKKTKR
jgi:hypothetical protein